MKKIYLLLVMVGISGMLFSQTQRRVMIEEATNASCGPCASQNPAFDALLQANPDKVAVVKYHWYFPGTDPMHAQNPDENDGRVGYYGINGVPTAVIDGTIPSGGTFGYPGAPSGYTQTLIDEHYNTPAPLEMTVYENIDAENDIVDIYTLLHAVQTVSGNPKLHTAVVEKHIHFNSAPGGNGERDFYDVMKKLVPGVNGLAIDNMEAGDYAIIHQQWDYSDWTIYDEAQLGVVSWLQSATSKTVYQSAVGVDQMFEPLYSLDVEISAVNNVPERTCTPHVEPIIEIRNNGNTPVSTIEISYTMNDGEMLNYTWSGELDFMESATIELPVLDFPVLDENVFHVEIVSVDGASDEYPKNNIREFTVLHSVKSEDFVRLIMRTDNNPEETTWEITNSEGEVVFSGGPYTEPNHMVNEVLNFDLGDCYLFTIYDAGGDGICCENGTGFYALSDHTNSAFVDGGNFKDKESTAFKILKGVGINDNEELEFSVFPNPAGNTATISFTLPVNSYVECKITDLAGRNLSADFNGNYDAGINTITCDLNDFSNGVYFIHLKMNEQIKTQKLVIKK